MEKSTIKNVYGAGNVDLELKEIGKMQKSADSYWSLWTNTCAGLYTVICC